MKLLIGNVYYNMENLFKNQIPILKPWLEEEEIKAVVEVIQSGWISQGPQVANFEQAVAKYVGAKYGVATNACTSALHLSLRLSGIKQGDEVICPSFTCMATTNSIHHTGALPVFADIDPKTYNLDPEAMANAITLRTRAILLVHQIGLPADRDRFISLVEKYHLSLIEDAACTFGATYKGQRIGGLGSPTCFSFHPRKMITTGEGGMIMTNDAQLAEKARMLRSTGASTSDLERHKAKGILVPEYTDTGYNYRLTDIQAAIGLVQLSKIDAMLKQRATQAKYYDESLSQLEEITTPYVPEYATHAYSSYLVRLTPKSRVRRDELLKKMSETGISCRIGIQPLHWEPYYQGRYGKICLPVTEEVAQDSMFLPIYPGLAAEEQNTVVNTLKKILAK